MCIDEVLKLTPFSETSALPHHNALDCLPALKRQLRSAGYVHFSTGLHQEQALAGFLLTLGHALGKVVPTRGELLIDALRPKSQQQAHQKSLSALTGLNEQPWHVDGAHLPVPYRYVLLASPNDHTDSRGTPTLICSASAWSKGQREDLHALVYGFDAGRARFLDTIGAPRRFWRFDPGCMRAGTPSAQGLMDQLAYVPVPEQKAIAWRSGDVLILENRRMLHRRLCAKNQEHRLLYRVSVM